ncbi:ABC transporter ATP-binding protein [Weissella koreensis]|uniref:ABC transporter ATP-binding protein n=1 Tax=Weissella koreensis TaxID=165096 RepID=UPI0002175887|nr:ABC transporter ATP-binding protein [Weissella koreensis]AEJ22936.1 ABC transporter, ATP-binding protein, putative [Weissella koreensis KACC 15510]MCZ9310375.1 ABC transporter ATP-binding protein [Weissella koreensis]
MTTAIIELTDVSKKYGTQVVLDDVSFAVNPGEIVGLIGPSGAGKSTIIKIALGMEVVDAGNATVFNKKMPERQILGELGYMAQSDALYEQLSGRENLEFFAEMRGVKNIDSEIERVAEIVDLTPHLDKYASGYSGGMKRRLSLAIAFLGNPKLLILDEPTVGIDPSLRRQIWHELQTMRNNGHTILVTTHVMDEAELVDRVALLLGGKLIANDSPSKLEDAYHVDTIEEVFLMAEEEK